MAGIRSAEAAGGVWPVAGFSGAAVDAAGLPPCDAEEEEEEDEEVEEDDDDADGGAGGTAGAAPVPAAAADDPAEAAADDAAGADAGEDADDGLPEGPDAWAVGLDWDVGPAAAAALPGIGEEAAAAPEAAAAEALPAPEPARAAVSGLVADAAPALSVAGLSAPGLSDEVLSAARASAFASTLASTFSGTTSMVTGRRLPGLPVSPAFGDEAPAPAPGPVPGVSLSETIAFPPLP
ncbi:hypothetical protein [Pannonibacter tanglangensis]|uniref:Uncharacterized protein n=1 Tax=Pannonibacter tanglangensis TaxID=2750084 RepID=A0ABW9ZNN3_9HYPH|nr:hypothetical protein [Pannonibacter sp. XCT-34]NBN65911.1 hypothetical protein [Pannonibacter sp. XCT-34]